MIRELHSHRVNGLNEALRIFVLDDPGAGGACHDYLICVPAPEVGHVADHIRERVADLESLSPKTLEKFDTEDGLNLFVCMDSPMGPIAVLWGGREPLAFTVQRIRFQNGPVKESGYNGNSHEALLAVLLDRMEGFQKGPFACQDNAIARIKLDEARLWLHKRTMDRVARGVEGTNRV